MAKKLDVGIPAVLSSINKAYGEGTILPASQAIALPIDRLSSTIFDLDIRLGGGWPRGRISMLKGDFSSCKSLVCMRTAAQAQRSCRFCGKAIETIDAWGTVDEHGCKCGRNEPMRVVWLDAEHSFDSVWFGRNRINLDELYVIQTEYAEQAVDVADRCIRSKECDLLIVDSIAALAPGIEIEKSAEDSQMAALARLMGKAMRKWTSGLNSYGLLADTRCTILLVNQMRLAIGGYHPTVTSPGGKALDFFESVEVRFKRKDYVVLDERPVAANIEYTVKKNKTAVPFGDGGMFSIFLVPCEGFQIGSVDTHVQVLRLASYWNLVKKQGSWITFPDGNKVQGDVQAGMALRNQPELMIDLMEKIEELEKAWSVTGKSPRVLEDETVENESEEESSE